MDGRRQHKGREILQKKMINIYLGHPGVVCAKGPPMSSSIRSELNCKRNCCLVRELQCISCIRVVYFFFWFFVPFYRSLPLIIGIIADHNGLGFAGNKCWGVIGFNVLLLVVPPVMLLLVCQVRCYPCHLWEAPLMLTILIHRMDESNWSLLWLSHGRYWFFSYSLDLYVFFY